MVVLCDKNIWLCFESSERVGDGRKRDKEEERVRERGLRGG